MTPKLQGLKQENVMVFKQENIYFAKPGQRLEGVACFCSIWCWLWWFGDWGLELSGGLLTHVSAGSAGKTQLGLENLGSLGLSLFLPLSIPLSLPP